MAQILKDAVKERIIDAAKIEFFENGYEKASMRSIAKRANMTVGNIYRYFDNKEAVHAFIISKVQADIDDAISSLSSNRISFDTSVYKVKVNINQIKDILDKFAEDLINIYSANQEEFMILFTADSCKGRIEDWFAKVIKYIIMTSYPLKKFEVQVDLITKSFGKSIFSGLYDFFKNDYEDMHSLCNMIKIYFRVYAYMLDSDMRLILNSLN